jgi:hypothetical protein
MPKAPAVTAIPLPNSNPSRITLSPKRKQHRGGGLFKHDNNSDKNSKGAASIKTFKTTIKKFNHKEGCFWTSSSQAAVGKNKKLRHHSYRIFNNTNITTSSSNVREELLCAATLSGHWRRSVGPWTNFHRIAKRKASGAALASQTAKKQRLAQQAQNMSCN